MPSASREPPAVRADTTNRSAVGAPNTTLFMPERR